MEKFDKLNITENIQKLITLAADHPELPIIAMVDGEVVGDDSYSRWAVGYEMAYTQLECEKTDKETE